MTSINQFLRANYNDTLSLIVWQGLQQCSSLYHDTCSLTSMVEMDQPYHAGPSYSEPLPESNPNSCLVYTPISLSSFVAMPAFLDCGYQKPCMSCAQLSTLTTQFKSLYPAYIGVPYLNSSATDAQVERNNLWARFLNYRTGLSLSVLDYMVAIRNCNLDSSVAAIGNGNDCGNHTGVDSLLVDIRLAPYPKDYQARKTIEFRDGFSSRTNDEFTTELNDGLGSCTVSYGVAGTSLSLNNAYALCAFSKPANDISLWEPADTMPCGLADTRAKFVAQLLIDKLRDSLSANFDSLYLAKCLSARNLEQFYATYQPLEYHYTLYYYDQGGNLVKTLPPAAVRPNYDPTYLANVAAQRADLTDLLPGNNEVLAMQYRYNTLNQVVAQHTPDAGNSRFWYDRLGRLAITQNAQQQLLGKYSYTLYDRLGRVTEVGQRPQSTAMSQGISQDTTALKSWIANNSAGDKEQITATVYDQPNTALGKDGDVAPLLLQRNLRNRVSYSMVFNAGGQMQYMLSDGSLVQGTNATYYSYDIHGNIDTLVQDFGGGFFSNLYNRFKKVVYNYDIISGKINDIAYQAGSQKGDQFFHHYNYDAENRLTSVQTSRDGIYWETEANYDYYRHGPLSRIVLGENKVQGVDYGYTLQGWLKGVNSSYVSSSADMGQDGQMTPGNPNIFTSRDSYSFSLHYFNGTGISNAHPYSKPDYISVNGAGSFVNSYDLDPNSTDTAFYSLYNGNISAITLDIDKFKRPIAYNYRYDQLNRLKSMNAYKQDKTYGHWLKPSMLTTDYREQIGYDPNGNILTYLRNGDSTQNAMDNLTYQYEKSSSGQLLSNKIRYVHDQVASANHLSDIDNQTLNTLAQVQTENSARLATDNYQYDAIGNLTKDASANITNIVWNVYGKITLISTNTGTSISFSYDANGNRIWKSVSNGTSTTLTYYVRDATGNVLSIYEVTNPFQNPHAYQREVFIYGSSRIGMDRTVIDVTGNVQTGTNNKIIRGNKLFELTNHLGNVLTTISDKKVPTSLNNTSVDYYAADVVTANDYYPFGMQMPSKTYTQPNSTYRYGFNGKENDNEVKGQGNQQDYGMRIYDPRLGRFLSVDPLLREYAWYAPYQFAGDNPIQSIDLDGLEPISTQLLRSTSSASGKIVANSWDVTYNGASHTVSLASGIAVDPSGNVLAFTSKGGLAATLNFSQAGASTDVSAGVGYSFTLYNAKIGKLTDVLGPFHNASIGVGLDKFGLGIGASAAAEMSTDNQLVGSTYRVGVGFGAGLPMNGSGQTTNTTGVIYAKTEYDKIYQMSGALAKQIQADVEDYNLIQAKIAGGDNNPNYAKALWQADMGRVLITYEKIGENKFEIIFKTQYRMYAQQANIPANQPSGTYKDINLSRTYRTGVILDSDTDGNYISEAYKNQMDENN